MKVLVIVFQKSCGRWDWLQKSTKKKVSGTRKNSMKFSYPPRHRRFLEPLKNGKMVFRNGLDWPTAAQQTPPYLREPCVGPTYYKNKLSQVRWLWCMQLSWQSWIKSIEFAVRCVEFWPQSFAKKNAPPICISGLWPGVASM